MTKPSDQRPLVGGVEAGGTKIVCAVGSGPDQIVDETRFPTRHPTETIAQILDFFRRHQPRLAAIGVASFGPVDPDPSSPTYGYVTTTVKPGWAQTDLAGAIGRALKLPIGFDTDVNGAALGEQRWGAGQGLHTFVYLTVGTGIGGGGMVNGELIHGLIHPEMGHMLIPHDRRVDPYEGCCAYHGDCWEGLASGPAVAARWECDPRTLSPSHPAWALEAEYLAAGLANIAMVLSPQRFILGGGIMEQSQLFPLVRDKFMRALNGYLKSPHIEAEIEHYIVAPALGNRAGVLGALALAQDAYSSVAPEGAA